MRKLISLLITMTLLLTFCAVSHAASGNTQVISCPEMEFSVLCDADFVWEYTQRDGITIYTEHEGSIPYVIVYRLEDWLVDVADFMREQFTPHMREQYGDDLVSVAEYDPFTIGGREMPAAVYTYRLQGYLIDMVRAFDTQDGHTVYFTAKYIQGRGEETLKALDLAVESYRPYPDYYSKQEEVPSGRWAYKTDKTKDGDIRVTFDEVVVTVPGSWEGKYEIQVNDSSVTFYQSASRKLIKENYGFEGGRLFSVAYAETDDYRTYLPSFADLGEGKEGYYYLIFPTDFQAYEKDEAVRNEYQAMYAGISFVKANSYSLLSPAPTVAPSTPAPSASAPVSIPRPQKAD